MRIEIGVQEAALAQRRYLVGSPQSVHAVWTGLSASSKGGLEWWGACAPYGVRSGQFNGGSGLP